MALLREAVHAHSIAQSLIARRGVLQLLLINLLQKEKERESYGTRSHGATKISMVRGVGDRGAVLEHDRGRSADGARLHRMGAQYQVGLPSLVAGLFECEVAIELLGLHGSEPTLRR